ncbi:MAG: hypothetical protein Q8O67_08290 [Deltaproteobacteria bacterium]|nr:hypothetical protein [Deltaproteobacteria bacterium]
MRGFLFLGVAAVVLCVAALPFCVVLTDTDAPAASTKAIERDDDDDDDAALSWLQNAAAIISATPRVDDTRTTAAQLDALDRAMSAGVDRCAPEIFEFDRVWLTRLQPRWGTLKPNFRPAWDAWLAIDGVEFDVVAARNCAELLRTADCALIPDQWEQCGSPFRGTFGAEEPCDVDDQCLSATCLAGACTAPNDCETDRDCPAGMACTGDDYFYTCTEREEPEEREPGTYVFGPGGLGESVNEALGMMKPFPVEEYLREQGRDPEAEAEDDCVCDAERDGKACIDDHCVQAVVVNVGDACDELHLCRGVLRSAVCLDGRCTAAFDVGHACSDHNECKDDLRCLDSACESPRHAGDPCDDDAACAFGLSCVDGDNDDTVCGLGLRSTERPAVRRVIYLDDLHEPDIDLQ